MEKNQKYKFNLLTSIFNPETHQFSTLNWNFSKKDHQFSVLNWLVKKKANQFSGLNSKCLLLINQFSVLNWCSKKAILEFSVLNWSVFLGFFFHPHPMIFCFFGPSYSSGSGPRSTIAASLHAWVRGCMSLKTFHLFIWELSYISFCRFCSSEGPLMAG